MLGSSSVHDPLTTTCCCPCKRFQILSSIFEASHCDSAFHNKYPINPFPGYDPPCVNTVPGFGPGHAFKAFKGMESEKLFEFRFLDLHIVLLDFLLCEGSSVTLNARLLDTIRGHFED